MGQDFFLDIYTVLNVCKYLLMTSWTYSIPAIQHFFALLIANLRPSTACPRCLDQFHLVSFYIKWVKTNIQPKLL